MGAGPTEGGSRGGERLDDHQQAVLLGVLRRAAGRPVSFRELHEAGIEYPASVVEELELAGVAVERTYIGTSSGRRLISGVRLRTPRSHGYAPPPTARRPRIAARMAAGPRTPASRRRVPAGGTSAADGPRGPEDTAPRASPLAALDAVSRRLDRLIPDALLAPLAVVTAAAVAAAIALVATSGEGQPRSLRVGGAPRSGARHGTVRSPSRGAGPSRPRASSASGAGAAVAQRPTDRSGPASAPPPPTSGPPPEQNPAPVSPAAALPASPATATPAPGAPDGASEPGAATALAAGLEARGHSLLHAGRPAEALAALQQALSATGESVPRCLEPASEACLTYAYALYDLGTALRMERRAAAAVPVLEQRLQIDNQRGTVAAQLALARREAGASH